MTRLYKAVTYEKKSLFVAAALSALHLLLICWLVSRDLIGLVVRILIGGALGG